jgi:hypothetical protein
MHIIAIMRICTEIYKSSAQHKINEPNEIGKATDVTNMKAEQEIKKRLRDLENEARTGGPFTEWQNIARKAAKQALEWVLEETGSLLTY